MFKGLPSGFTLDLEHYTKRKFRHKKLPKVPSDYYLGLIFGAFLEGGTSHLSLNRNGSEVGSVRWYIPYDGREFAGVLIDALDRVFGLYSYSYYRPNYRPNITTVICNNKALSRLLREFGKGESKEIPLRFLVDNREYLRGIHDGIMGCRKGNVDKSRVDLLANHIETYLSSTTY